MSEAATRRRGRPARNDRTVEETRRAILDAALADFARRGFEGASLRDIAQAAGVEHSLVRYHFTDKMGLWRAALGDLVDRMEAAERIDWAACRHLPPVERFKIMLRAHVRYCAQHPEHARIMVHEAMGPSERAAFIAERIVRPQHARMARALERLMDEGHIPRSPVRPLIYILSAAAQAPYTLAWEARAAYGVDTAAEAEIEAHADTLIGLVLR